MTYLGLDVLDQVAHNRRGVYQDDAQREFELLDTGTGTRSSDARGSAPTPVRPFQWTCLDRAAIAQLRAFVHARKGRAVPFWVPTYQQDLTLATDLTSGGSTATIRWVGYSQYLFANTGRRHLAFIQPGGAMLLRKVTGVSDPGTYITEDLALSASVSPTQPAATTIISFLRLCRLESDELVIDWKSRSVAEATLQLHDLGMEAPA